MKRVAFCAAILAVFTLASAPAYARTTLADFRGGGEAIERLLERIHKHNKIVVRRPGDEITSTSTSTNTLATPAGVPPDVSIDPH
jgi:hypothetical protein